MFQRIARRHADGSEEPAGSEAADGQTPEAAVDAPTEQVEPVAPAPEADQPTAFQPAVAAEEQPTTIQPAASTPPSTATDGQPTAAGQTPSAGLDDQPTTLQPAASAAIAAATAPDAAQPSAPAQAEAPAQPAGEQPAVAEQPAPRRPGFRARGRMRRRLRYLRKLREIEVRDLGGLAFDLRRFERKRDDLVAQKVDQIRACDDELRALELALGERRDLRDVREPGIGGTCPRCFAIFGSADRFCASCGAALGGAVQGPAQVPLAPAPPPAAAAPAPASPPAAAPPSPAAPPEASGSGSGPNL